MSDIFFSNNFEEFISSLEAIFKTPCQKFHFERRLQFDNEIGNGIISIYPLIGDLISISFQGVLSRVLDLGFKSSPYAAINFMYVVKGGLTYYAGSHHYTLADPDYSNCITGPRMEAFERVQLPEGIHLDFNVIKLFNINYLKEEITLGKLYNYSLRERVSHVKHLQISYLGKGPESFEDQLNSIAEQEGDFHFEDYLCKKRIDTILSMQISSL